MESIHLRRGLALSLSKGFTLVELMVVLAIIGIITAVTITSQDSFNKTLILSNTAYDIALAIRSAETFGIGSRARTDAGVISTNAGYGVHFDMGTSNSFILFADTAGGTSCAGMTPDCKSGDHIYNAPRNVDALVQTYTLGNGITISGFCTYFVSRAGGMWTCMNARSQSGQLDISFARPNPDAFISANGSYSSSNTSACLIIASSNAPSGPYRYIKVESSGAITANATQCP